MLTPLRLTVLAWLMLAGVSSATSADFEAQQRVPAPLQEWVDWATWEEGTQRGVPRSYQDANQRYPYWPSTLVLKVQENQATFTFSGTAYGRVRVALPGSATAWPVNVKVNGNLVPVVPHEGVPSVELGVPSVELPHVAKAAHEITGEFRWSQAPRQLQLPSAIGLVDLTLDGEPVPFPSWDTKGILWLRQEVAQDAEERDFISAKVYSVLSDGIPMRWESVVELTVSGKNREETLGVVLPEGWRLAELSAPIPVMLDEQGNLKAQVRSGRWEIRVAAFRLDPPTDIRFPAGATPVVKEALVGFRADPSLRMADLTGVTQVDASLTTFPAQWAGLPIYRWETEGAIGLAERMRGSGEEKGNGLTITRKLWLDEKRGGFTFSDEITGRDQTLWRLDVSPGQELESARAGGKGQLITRNPATNATGVEIRDRALRLTATGQINHHSTFPASGWQANTESLRIRLELPPGWRLLAGFGADKVEGDWLTAWTLLDLFLLLVFTVAVFRLWGVKAAALAFVAFALAYHEPGAPVYSWLALLVPLALLRVVKSGKGRVFVQALLGAALVVLFITLVPFIAQQVQQAIYPQLEPMRTMTYRSVETEDFTGGDGASGVVLSAPSSPTSSAMPLKDAKMVQKYTKSWSKPAKDQESIYAQEATAKVQAGRGVPTWEWRTLSLEWNGPVTPAQEVHLVLLPRPVVQGLTLLRIALLILLAAVLLGGRKALGAFSAQRAPLWLFAGGLLLMGSSSAMAEQTFGYPDQEMLNTLRERIVKTPSAFPTAADIPFVRLDLAGRNLTLDAEIHTGAACAVPLPGRFPTWSPLRVTVNGETTAVLRRDGGYLWVALPKGVHRVQVEAMLSPQGEWEWSYQLAPRKVEVNAPAWNVTGWSEEPGRPGPQLFFSRKERKEGAAASGYDRQEVESWVSVERTIQLGLTWSVETKVIRRTPVGRALNLRIPLLKGERVLSQDISSDQGFVEIRLGAQETEGSWHSDLERQESLHLTAAKGVPWVEHWRVEVSPIWNIALSGLKPIFSATSHLIPTWQPWPGEEVDLAISRPEAVEGPTVAIGSVKQSVSLGARQQTSKLELMLQSSLGEEFTLALPENAEITELKLKDQPIPVRRDQGKLAVTLTPGSQSLEVNWRQDEPLRLRTQLDAVQLPYESANIETQISIPDNRWTLWASGPLRGPAVRFWGVLAMALLGGWVLGRVPASPLKGYQWSLLFVGVTQGNVLMALVVIAWFFLLVWRGQESFRKVPSWFHDIFQLAMVVGTLVFVGILLAVVWSGLLGRPEMFISGNGSHLWSLRWFEPQGGEVLPRPAVGTVSIWWYRLLMLLWALWLANAFVGWLGWAWKQYSLNGVFRPLLVKPPTRPAPPANQK